MPEHPNARAPAPTPTYRDIARAVARADAPAERATAAAALARYYATTDPGHVPRTPERVLALRAALGAAARHGGGRFSPG